LRKLPKYCMSASPLANVFGPSVTGVQFAVAADASARGGGGGGTFATLAFASSREASGATASVIVGSVSGAGSGALDMVSGTRATRSDRGLWWR